MANSFMANAYAFHSVCRSGDGCGSVGWGDHIRAQSRAFSSSGDEGIPKLGRGFYQLTCLLFWLLLSPSSPPRLLSLKNVLLPLPVCVSPSPLCLCISYYGFCLCYSPFFFFFSQTLSVCLYGSVALCTYLSFSLPLPACPVCVCMCVFI